jgi:hypothetical protein
MDISKIHEKMQKGVLLVRGQNKANKPFGSAFVISTQGYLATCAHVFRNLKKVSLIRSDGLAVKAQVLYTDKKEDIAILKTEAGITPELPLNSGESIKGGNDICALGFPLRNKGKVDHVPNITRGTIMICSPEEIKFNVDVSLGMSGGPLIDINSYSVIGIVKTQQNSIELEGIEHSTAGQGYAIPANKLITFCKLHNIPYVLKYTKSTVISLVKDYFKDKGYQVEVQVNIGRQGYDLVATLKREPFSFDTVIDCNIENPIEDLLVEQFSAKIAATRRSSPGISALMVYSGEAAPHQIDDAKKSGVELLSIDDIKKRQFKNIVECSLKEVISLDEESKFDVGDGFIEPPFKLKDTEETISHSKKILNSWIQQKEAQSIAILGNFGTGKTTLVKHLVAEASREYFVKPEELRIPIYLDLKTWKKGIKIEQILATKSDGWDLPWMDEKDWLQLLKKGRLLLVLDGFDEMSEMSDRHSIAENIREILHIVSLGKNIIVITCRTNFFYTRMDEDSFFDFGKIYLEPWEMHHIEKYVKVRKKSRAKYYYDGIKNIFNLKELCQTPIFLKIALEILPIVKRSKKAKSKIEITSSYLYEEYCKKWLHKEAQKRGGGLLNVEEKINILEKFAYKMLYEGKRAIQYIELLEEVKEIHRAVRIAEDCVNDMTTHSFFVREQDEFKFSHYSFLEFFVARKYFKELQAKKIKDFGQVYFKEEIFKFLSEMIHIEGTIEKVHSLAEKAMGHRPRIHCILLLGRLVEIEPESAAASEVVLEEIVKNDKSLRVAGHAAEILYTKFNNRKGFEILRDRISGKGKDYTHEAPKEPSVGWYLDERRNFTLEDTTYIEFFIEISRRPEKDDENLWWFSLSILSRIENVSEHFTKGDQARLMEIAKVHKNRSIRAYATTILGKVATPKDTEVIEALNDIIDNDEDDGVKDATRRAIKRLLSK